MKAVFEHARNEAANIRTFYFRPEKPVHYTAGQYTELTLPHPHPDKRGRRRWFTLSSSPTDKLLSITTKYAGDGKTSSFKKALFKLKPGTEVHLADPMGDFVLPKLIQTPLVFVAGGIGVTPYHSMLEWLAATGEERPIKLLYGVRSEDEIVFEETFGRAGVRPAIVVSDPSPAWGGERGRVSAELILGLGKPSEDALVYLSGPEPMVQALAKDLHASGLPKDRIVTDEFPNYTAI
ncbi:MAG TPA: FAD-dependent oxidoreductase [Candidatus Saccharimonadales bacterium]|nr:FAD-dependent oxidoreductase [Candidatus Saccharimonadales bacterium]